MAPEPIIIREGKTNNAVKGVVCLIFSMLVFYSIAGAPVAFQIVLAVFGMLLLYLAGRYLYRAFINAAWFVFSPEGIFYRNRLIRWEEIDHFYTVHDSTGEQERYYLYISFSDGKKDKELDLPTALSGEELREYIAIFSTNPHITDEGHETKTWSSFWRRK